jgi:hypothetical protein
MTTASLWEGIGNAEIYDRGKYFKPGFQGIVIVKKTLAKETRKSGMAFIVELEVATTNMLEQHSVGSKGTWFVKLIDKDVAFPNIATWAAACCGVEGKDNIKKEVLPILKDLMTYATDHPDANEFIDVKVYLSTEGVKTKADTDFTRYDFSPIAQ